MNPATPTPELIDAARVGFAGLAVSPPVQEAALGHLAAWLDQAPFAAYRAQVVAQIGEGRWAHLLDSFYQVLPFGTGGRRGTVGVGPNRYNPFTLGASVQGHVAWLRRTRGAEPRAGRPLVVVIGYDVRRFQDAGGRLVPGVPCPVDGLGSRDFAELAAEVYAAGEVTVWLPPADAVMSTPELSFAIRYLHADGGLVVSASHNPPDDNGGKFYDHTGSQEVPPRDELMAKEVDGVTHIERMPFDRARAAGLVRDIGSDLHEAYLAANLACARAPSTRSARIVFTPLHGTGRTTAYPVLQRAGFEVELEPSQAEYDGAFPAVPFRAPNPEVPRSMERAAAHAEKIGADIVFATDPDADRIGLMVRHPGPGAEGNWKFLTGNEIAALVCHGVLSGRARTRPLVLTTEVTSRLLERVARARGARVVGHLLVGFKYIGEALDKIEREGSFAGIDAVLADFAMGAEESHGVLVTPAMRDKDAAGGALVLAEMASQEKDRGRTLIDVLEDLWREVGYVRNVLVNTVLRGAEGRERIQAIQRSFREDRPARVAGREVTAFHDRQDPSGPFGPIQSGTDRASRDVLVFELGPDARIVLRPSGTEPKNKIYAELCGRPGADLAVEVPRVQAECRAMADAFALDVLGRVGIELPAWALRCNDLLSVDHKIEFAREVLPELVRRLHQGEDAGPWLDARIASFGKDARGLVADAVSAYVAAERVADPERLLALFAQ